MKAEFIESHIARGNRNLLLIGLILTVLGGGLAALLNRWFPALMAVPGVMALGAWQIRVVNPGGHPIYKQLSRYGDARQMAQQVNQEFAGNKPVGSPHFGANWLAQGDTYCPFVAQWQDIAWIHIYTRKQNGLGWHHVRVWSGDGRQCVAPVGT